MEYTHWLSTKDQTHHEPPPQEEEKVATHKGHCGVHCQNEGPAVHCEANADDANDAPAL